MGPIVPLVLACFFLSGASGLVFEVVWTRELGLVFGSTTLAISTVLSAFMGGLALGSHLSGRYSGRIADPLRAYALAEAGVGLYALTVPLWLLGYPGLNALLFRTVGDHYGVLSLLRFFATALLLLLPTTLMGATLPLLSHFLVRHKGPRSVAFASVHIGTLFALNTAGAVLGTFLAGFVLLPLLGVRTTNLLAAATNLSLALMVLAARRRLAKAAPAPVPPERAEIAPSAFAGPDGERPGSGPGEGQDDPAPKEVMPTREQRLLAVGSYAVSGATAMIYQVLWTRALAIVLGSSVYSFTLILLAFLVGLALGAAATARLVGGLRRPVLALGLVHLLTLLMVSVSYLTIDKLPAAFLVILRGGSFTVDGLIITQFVLAALAVLPATLAMGAVMPLTMRIYTASIGRVGRDVGTAYALNTVGAICGSFAAGFVVLPVLGLQRGILGCAGVTALLGVLLCCMSERRRLGVPVALVSGAAAVLFVTLAPRWNLEHFSAGLFRVSIANEIIGKQKWPVPKLLYYHDGISTTVSVEQWSKNLALKNNGKVDASNSDDMATQIMVGLMPLLFHPGALDAPPRVAVIGYGSGVTIGAVTQFPIGHADVVELEPAVVEAGDRFFGPYNHRPSQDPRVRVIIGDGRNFLSQGSDRYDVIVSEPSNPWITGVSSLFTQEYWRLARGRLADDGVFCQWAQLYEMSQKNIKTLLRSFATVFPHTYIFSAEDMSSDVILVASPRPLPLDLARLRRNFDARRPVLRAELLRGKVDSAEDLLADLLLTPDEIAAFTAGAELNTDDNALIEFAAPRDLLGYMKHDPYIHRIYGGEWPYGRFVRYLQNHGSPLDEDEDDGTPQAREARRAETYARLGRALLRHGKREAAARLLLRSRGLSGGVLEERVSGLLSLFGIREMADREVPLTAGDGPGGIDGLEPLGAERIPGTTPAEQARMNADYKAALRAVRDRKWAHALKALRDWPARWVDEAGPDFQLLLGFLLYKTELADDAVDRLLPLPEDEAYVQRRPALLYYLARAEYMNAMTRSAVDHMERYVAAGSAPALGLASP